MALVTYPTCLVTINNIPLETMQWEVMVGAQGSIGMATIETDRLSLKKAGIDLASMVASGDVEVMINANDGGLTAATVFGGVLDKARTQRLTDIVTLTAHDWAAVLMDEKRVPASFGAARSPSQFATNVATAYGFTPLVENTPIPLDLGPLGKRVQTSPQPPWSILQYLAKQVGFECFVTPAKELVFRSPQSPDYFDFHWRPAPSEFINFGPTRLPLIELNDEFSPRRNKDFVVEVKGCDRFGRTTSGKATSSAGVTPGVIGAITGGTGNVINPLSPSLQGKPVFSFQRQGLTNDQCQQLAQAYMKDIAKREVLVDALIMGYPGLKPQALVNFIGDDLDGYLLNRNFNVTDVQHTFGVPQGETQSTGFVTKFKALSEPPEDLAGLFN